MIRQHLLAAGSSGSSSSSQAAVAGKTPARLACVVASALGGDAAAAGGAPPHDRPPQPQQPHFPLQMSLGTKLLQQPHKRQPPTPQQLGVLLLQQPAIVWPHQQQPQHHQQQPAGAQLCQRGQRAMPQEVLAAAEGFTVTRRQKYMAPEAAELQGLVLPPATWQRMQRIAERAAQLDPGLSRVQMAMAPALLLEYVNLEALSAQPTTHLDTSTHTHTGSSSSSRRLPDKLHMLAARLRRRSSEVGHGGGSSSSSSLVDSSRPAAYTDGSSGVAATPAQEDRHEAGASAVASGAVSGTSSSPGRRRRTTSSAITSSSTQASGLTLDHSSSTSRRRRTTTSSSSSSSTITSSSTRSSGLTLAHDSSSSNSRRRRTSSTSSTSSQAPSDQDDGEVLLQLLHKLSAQGIELPEARFGQHSGLVCPECGGGDKQERSFALNLQQSGVAVWLCHRANKCGWTGRVALTPGGSTGGGSSSSRALSSSLQPASQPVLSAVPADVAAKLQPLTPEVEAFFQQRGISTAVLQRNRVGTVRGAWDRPVIALPYYCRATAAGGGQHVDRLVNIKYRTLNKRFSQVAGGQQVFYGLNDLQGADSAIIVEGELDKLAIESATGITAVLSLPAGAMATPNPENKKLACVDAAAAQLSRLQSITIALDADEPGWATAIALQHKLKHLQQQQQLEVSGSRSTAQHGISQRGALRAAATQPPPPPRQQQQLRFLFWPASRILGRQTLHHVSLQAAAAGVALNVDAAAGCKDANDVLMRCGPEALRLYIEQGAIQHSGGC